MHPARRNAAVPEPDHCPACSSRLLWADRVLVGAEHGLCAVGGTAGRRRTARDRGGRRVTGQPNTARTHVAEAIQLLEGSETAPAPRPAKADRRPGALKIVGVRPETTRGGRL